MSRGKLPYGNDRKAANAARVDKHLGRSHGGKVDSAQGVGHYKRGGAVDEEGGTRISINIAPPGGPAGPAMLPPVMKPPAPPMPPPGAMGAPPGMPGMGGGPPGLAGMGPKLPGMKRGGGVKSMDAGAGGGKGRLEKTRMEKRSRGGTR
jgi:hypothetical protein